MIPKGLIFDIKRFSVNDGPGIRTTVFFKGCPLTCWWCHNPEGRSAWSEEITITRRLNGREFLHQETVGRTMTPDEVMAEIGKENIFHETSGGGVTFSGGEPLQQHEFLVCLAEACREWGIHTCLDTSGYCDPVLFKSLIPMFDLILYDIKMVNRERHIRYTGVPNDGILVNLKETDRSGLPYIIRVPLIPGINDDIDNINDLKNFLQELSRSDREIHFLPYHPLAGHKLRMLGMEDKMGDQVETDNSVMEKLVIDFKAAGYRVKIGG